MLVLTIVERHLKFSIQDIIKKIVLVTWMRQTIGHKSTVSQVSFDSSVDEYDVIAF